MKNHHHPGLWKHSLKGDIFSPRGQKWISTDSAIRSLAHPPFSLLSRTAKSHSLKAEQFFIGINAQQCYVSLNRLSGVAFIQSIAEALMRNRI